METISITDFERLLTEHPELTATGFIVDSDDTQFTMKEREALFTFYSEFLVCCEFASHLRKQQCVSRQMSSYGLKHVVERWATKRGILPNYIPKGVFIAAMIYMGFNYKRIKNSRNAYFNVSMKSLREFDL